MHWYETLMGILAMITCAGWTFWFVVILGKAVEECRRDAEHIKELKRRMRQMENGGGDDI